MDKILEGYRPGEALMDSPGNEMHLGQVIQDKLIAFFKV